MLKTIYMLRVEFVMVNGRGLNLFPGQYADVEDFDANRLVEQGAAFFANEKGVHDNEVSPKHCPGKPSRRPTDDENIPKSGRVKRRRRNNRNDKRGNGKA